MGRYRHPHVSSWLIRLGEVVFLLVGLGCSGRSQVAAGEAEVVSFISRGRTWSRRRGTRSGRLPWPLMASAGRGHRRRGREYEARMGGALRIYDVAARAHRQGEGAGRAPYAGLRTRRPDAGDRGACGRHPDPRPRAAARAGRRWASSAASPAPGDAPDGKLARGRSTRGRGCGMSHRGESSATFRVAREPSTLWPLSPDGQTLASGGGGGDRTVKLWDVASGTSAHARGTHPAGRGGRILPERRLVASARG